MFWKDKDQMSEQGIFWTYEHAFLVSYEIRVRHIQSDCLLSQQTSVLSAKKTSPLADTNKNTTYTNADA